MSYNFPQGNLICGDIVIPGIIPQMITTIIFIMKVVIPILLIIFGMLDMGKAVVAKKEEDMKKYQSSFIKRLISAVIVFLIVAVVQFILGLIGAGTDSLVGLLVFLYKLLWHFYFLFFSKRYSLFFGFF